MENRPQTLDDVTTPQKGKTAGHNSELSNEERERYARQLCLAGIGLEGQKRLRAARVLVVGAGGLGSPTLLYLAAAGVGTLGIVDFDCVEPSNLQRQICHTTSRVGTPKVQSAARAIGELNPNVAVKTYDLMFTAANGPKLIEDYDIVVSATDSYSSKFLINDLCVAAAKPYVHGGIMAYGGQVLTYVPGSACLRCLYGAPPTDAADNEATRAGVLGSVAGLVGTIQATEVLKLIAHVGTPLTNKMLMVDGLTMQFTTMNIAPSANCTVCGKGN